MNVRTEMLRRIVCAHALAPLALSVNVTWVAAYMRPMVGALTCNTGVLITGPSSRYSYHSVALINIGISGFSRLPHTRSVASHNTVNAWATTSSYTWLRSRTSLGGPISPRTTRISHLVPVRKLVLNDPDLLSHRVDIRKLRRDLGRDEAKVDA